MIIGSTTEETRGMRVAVDPLVYVNFPKESAFILNLSDRGMAIQAMEVLEPGRSYRFSFPLPETDAEIHGSARISWADQSGRAGMEFVEVSAYDRSTLTQWVMRNRHKASRH